MRHIDQIPLEWCYGGDIVLEMTQKRLGEEISVKDIQKALFKIQYQLKPYDIVFVMTSASKYYGQPNYAKMPP